MDEPIDPYGAGWYPPTNPYVSPAPSYAPPPPAPYGTPQYPLPQPQAPHTPPNRGHRTRLVIISGIFVAAAVILTTLVLSGGSTKKPAGPIVVPTSIGDYQQITDATADRVKEAMQSEAQSFGLAKAFLDHTSLGVYGSGASDQPNLILVIGHTDAVPGLQNENAGDAVDALLSGAVAQPATYPSGSHGGSLKCGPAAEAAALETACAWYDNSTIGLLLSINPAQAPAALAVLSNVVRDEVK